MDPLKSMIRSLRIVLVLSFIGSGWNTLSYLILGVSLPMMQEAMGPVLSQMPEEFQTAYEMVMNMPQVNYIILGLLSALSLTGAILMWNLKTNGWHCYTLAQLLMLAVPLLFVGKAGLGLGDVMMTALFVAYYFFTLRNINRLRSEANHPEEDEQQAIEKDSETQE